MRTIEDLRSIKAQYEKNVADKEKRGVPSILVHMGTCGIANGADEVYKAILAEIKVLNISEVVVTQTGCPGLCYDEPLITVSIPGETPYIYGRITPSNAREIARKHLVEQQPMAEWLVNRDDQARILKFEELNYIKHQMRIALRNCGRIDPESLEDYIAQDGYFAARCFATISRALSAVIRP